jgi:uncharacterized Zn-finger protein
MKQIKDQIVVKMKTVQCQGSGGALGHPAVYLNLGEKKQITCPYCSRNFILESSK